MAAKFAANPVPQQTLKAEVGNSQLNLTVTKAAATGTATLAAFVGNPAPLKPFLTTMQTAALTGYRLALVTKATVKALLLTGLAALLIGGLLAAQQSMIFGVAGVAVIVAGCYLLALGVWGVGVTHLKKFAAIVCGVVLLLPIIPLLREQLFGAADQPGVTHHWMTWVGQEWWRPAVVVLAVVVLLSVAWSAGKRSARAPKPVAGQRVPVASVRLDALAETAPHEGQAAVAPAPTTATSAAIEVVPPAESQRAGQQLNRRSRDPAGGESVSPGRFRPQVGPLALPAEQGEHLNRLVVGRAEPVRDPGVEFGRLTRNQHQVLITQLEPQPAVQDVHPFIALVGLLLGRARSPGRRDDHLVGLYSAGPFGQRNHGHPMTGDRPQVHPRVAGVWRTDQLVDRYPVRAGQRQQQFQIRPSLARLQPGQRADRNSRDGREFRQSGVRPLAERPQPGPDSGQHHIQIIIHRV